MALTNFTKTALKNLFSKPATRNYPQEPREYTERTRGRVECEISNCILCGLCAKKCPTGAITVDKEARTWTIKRFGCIQCGNCVEACPKKTLSMHNRYPAPSDEKYTDTVTKPAPTPEEIAAEEARKEALKKAALAKAEAAKKAKEQQQQEQ